MSNFLNFLNRNEDRRNIIQLFTELGAKDCFELFITEDRIGLKVKNLSKLSPLARSFVERNAHKDITLRMEVLAMSECLGKGPKIFKPTCQQLQALEKMSLNIEFEDFQTPFTATVIELPKEYCVQRKVEDFHAEYVLIYRTKDLIIHDILDEKLSSMTWFFAGGIDNLEQFLQKNEKYQRYDENGNISHVYVEEDHHTAIKRACLNYCLLLDEVGIRRCGPESINQYNQLVKWCQKKNKHTAKNELDLIAQPIVYALNKEPINLVRIEVDGKVVSDGEPKHKVATHWRRGHYRMQPYGPKNELRKRIRIPPVMVNKNELIVGREYTT